MHRYSLLVNIIVLWVAYISGSIDSFPLLNFGNHVKSLEQICTLPSSWFLYLPEPLWHSSGHYWRISQPYNSICANHCIIAVLSHCTEIYGICSLRIMYQVFSMLGESVGLQQSSSGSLLWVSTQEEPQNRMRGYCLYTDGLLCQLPFP